MNADSITSFGKDQRSTEGNCLAELVLRGDADVKVDAVGLEDASHNIESDIGGVAFA